MLRNCNLKVRAVVECRDVRRTFEALGVVLVVDMPHKAVLLQQLVRWVLEVGEGLGQTSVARG